MATRSKASVRSRSSARTECAGVRRLLVAGPREPLDEAVAGHVEDDGGPVPTRRAPAIRAMSRGTDRQLVQITMRGIVVSGSAADFARARRKFAREHSLRLPGFLTPELVGVVQRSINRARFRRRHHQGFGSDLELQE